MKIVYDVTLHYEDGYTDDIAICKTLTGAKTVAQEHILTMPRHTDALQLCWEFEGNHWKAEHEHLKYTIHRVEVLD